MPLCSVCGKQIPKMPLWLESVNTTFRCGSPKCNELVTPAVMFADEEEDKEAKDAEVADTSLEQEIEAELAEDEEEE